VLINEASVRDASEHRKYHELKQQDKPTELAEKCWTMW
jgi:hypothetical protein